MQNWKQIEPEALEQDAFTMIGKQWMLVTAEKDGKVNTMTASWGGIGIMWNKKVAFVFIRPQRYTKEFIDDSTTLSLSFYDEEMRKTLSYLGTKSGRDEDKITNASLHVTHKDGVPFFEEAATVLLCRKLYAQNMDETCYIDTNLITQFYAEKDFHIMYIVEIQEVLKRTDH